MADNLRLRGQVSVLSESHHFEGRPAGRILQPDIGEIQAQHLRQHVEQSTDNLEAVRHARWREALER